MVKIKLFLILFLIPSCFTPNTEEEIHSFHKVKEPETKHSNNVWTYYSHNVLQDKAEYKLPKRTAYQTRDLFKKLDLSKIQSWKQIYIQTRKKFSKNDDFNNPEYQLFSRDFFEEQLSKIHSLYLEHYSKKQAWTAHSPLINEEFFLEDSTFVEKISVSDQSKIAIIGDLHSGFHSLLQFIFDLDNKGFFEKDQLKLKKNRHLIFLGDMVDRGPYGLEILFFVFYLKQLNFDQIHVNNGNHEDFSTFSRYGLTDEIKGQFGIDMKGAHDYPFLSKLLQSLPSAYYLTYRGKTYHLSHGVVNPHYAGADDKGFFTNESSPLKDFLNSGNRFDFVNKEKSDNFRWSDCSQTNQNGQRMLTPTRGSKKLFTFDHRFINDYLNFNGLTAIIRGHQDNTNLGLIRNGFDQDEEAVFLDTDKEFELYGGRYPEIFWEPLEKYRKIILQEEKDFTVLTTSSASIARDIDTAYVILSSNN